MILNNDMVESALRDKVVLATAKGKAAAIQALEIEKIKALENQQSMGRSGDVDVIDLREDNAFMQARNQAMVHDHKLAELEKLANSIVVEQEADQGILPLGTEFKAVVEYDDGGGFGGRKIQHCKLGGPCEQILLKKTETGATWLSYKASMGRAIWQTNVGEISLNNPLGFSLPKGKARIISFEIIG